MKIASAAYPIDKLASFDDYRAKIRDWVAQAQSDLLVFPEYGAMELESLMGEDAGDLHASIDFLQALIAPLKALHQELAQEFNLTILGASLPEMVGQDLPVNRAYLYHPDGRIEYQDKQIMTRFEREEWLIEAGEPLRIFEIVGVKTGVLICYDSEFPLLGRKLIEMGAELILVPSCTDSLAGFYRVRIGAMARALEGQCVVVQSPTIGSADWSQSVDENHGAPAIFAPPDIGFPANGVIVEGSIDAPGWVRADVNFEDIKRVRANGAVLNVTHWNEQF